MLFEEAMNRYSHIDGELFEYNFNSSDESYLKIEFYPWWEHPKLQYAIENNLDWRFVGERSIIMSIVPRNLIKFSIDSRFSAIDIDFCLDHPLLWQYYDHAQLFINEDIDFQLLRSKLIEKIPIIEDCIDDYLPRVSKYKAPYCLGNYPKNIFNALIGILNEVGVPCFPKEEVEFKGQIKLILFDENNYLIADDFLIDVPEVLHKDEDVIVKEK